MFDWGVCVCDWSVSVCVTGVCIYDWSVCVIVCVCMTGGLLCVCVGADVLRGVVLVGLRCIEGMTGGCGVGGGVVRGIMVVSVGVGRRGRVYSVCGAVSARIVCLGVSCVCCLLGECWCSCLCRWCDCSGAHCLLWF